MASNILIEKSTKLGFKSQILWNNEYKHSSLESLRYCLWLEELKKFLRDDKKFHVVVDYDDYDKFWFFYLLKINEVNDINWTRNFKTYEDALEAGILKTIEFVEEN